MFPISFLIFNAGFNFNPDLNRGFDLNFDLHIDFNFLSFHWWCFCFEPFHSDVRTVPRRVFLNVVLVVVAGLKEVAGVIPILLPIPMLPI